MRYLLFLFLLLSSPAHAQLYVVQPSDIIALNGLTTLCNPSGLSASPVACTVAQMQSMLSIPALPVTVGNGGTGITSGTSGGVPCYTGSTTIASSSALASTSLVLGGGAGVCPSSEANWTIASHNMAGTGSLTVTGGITTNGANAGVVFVDRATSTNWQWYGSTTANLYNGSSNVVTIDTSGNVTSGASLKAGTSVFVGGNIILQVASAYNDVLDATGANAILLGKAGDLTNYYQQTNHYFYSRNTTTLYGQVLASGASFLGTNTNDSAAAGFQGEYASSVVLIASEISLTSGQPANMTSKSLTAGDWDVNCELWTDLAGTTTVSVISAAITTTSATLPTVPADGTGLTAEYPTNLTGQNLQVPVGPTRLSLSGPTTVYCVAQATFAISTAKVYGKLRARRVR